MTFAWTPDLATGSATVDAQHKELFAAADDLFSACQLGKEKQEVEKTMQFLLDYTIKHFSDEEALQKKYGYQNCPAHKQMHDSFTDTVREFAGRLSKGGPTDDFISEVYVAVGEWLLYHVKNVDVAMAQCLRE